MINQPKAITLVFHLTTVGKKAKPNGGEGMSLRLQIIYAHSCYSIMQYQQKHQFRTFGNIEY